MRKILTNDENYICEFCFKEKETELIGIYLKDVSSAIIICKECDGKLQKEYDPKVLFFKNLQGDG